MVCRNSLNEAYHDMRHSPLNTDLNRLFDQPTQLTHIISAPTHTNTFGVKKRAQDATPRYRYQCLQEMSETILNIVPECY